MSAARFGIIVLSAAVCLFGQYGLSPDGRRLETPGRMLAPTKDADCENYQAIWDKLQADLENRHQQCLDAHQGQKGNPNSGPGANQPCSYSDCQSLHTARGMVQSRGHQMVAACRADLQVYKAEQSRQQALLRQQQQQAQSALQQQQQQAEVLRQQAEAQRKALQDKSRADAEAARQKIRDQMDRQLQARQAAEAQQHKQLQDAQNAAQAQSADLKKAAEVALNSANPQSPTSSAVPGVQDQNDAAVLDALQQTLAQKDGVDKAISDLQKPYTIVDEKGNVTAVVDNVSDADPNPAQGYKGAGAEVVKGLADAVISALGVGGSSNPEAAAVKDGYDAVQGLIKANNDPAPGATATGLAAAAAGGLGDGGQPLAVAADGTEAILKTVEGKDAAAEGAAIKAAGGLAAMTTGNNPATEVTGSVGGIVSGAATVAEGVEHLQDVSETAKTLAERGEQLDQVQQAAIATLQAKSQSLDQLAQNLAGQAGNQQPIAPATAPVPQDAPLSTSPAPSTPLSPGSPAPAASIAPPSAPPVPPGRSAETDAVLKAYSPLLNPPPTTIDFGSQAPASRGNNNITYNNYDNGTAIPDTIAFGVPQQDISLTSSGVGVTYCADQPNVPCQIDFGSAAQPAQTYNAPAAPSNPSDSSQCDALASQWDALIARINADHDRCLQEFGNGHRTQGRLDLNNSVCETRACQAVHNSLLRAPLMKNGVVAACLAGVNKR